MNLYSILRAAFRLPARFVDCPRCPTYSSVTIKPMHTLRVAVNVLNRQLQTTDRGWFSSLDVRLVAKNSSPYVWALRSPTGLNLRVL
jgi:hypothetical protein